MTLVIQAWLSRNMVIVQFVYGLSFFSLGLVVGVQNRPGSQYRLAKRLRALTAFAFIHAFADWGVVFIPLHALPSRSPAVAALLGLRTMLGAVSFGCLMHFGLGLLLSERTRLGGFVTRSLAPMITVGWLLAFFGFPVVFQHAGLATWYSVSEVWSRYLLGLPSGVIVALGLLNQAEEFRRDQLNAHVRNLYWSAGFFALYGLTAGLIVPPQQMWPAAVLNTERFLHTVGVPIELFRTVTAIGAVFATSRLMGVFQVETTRLLYQAQEERALLQERERIARNLHDGILQTLYGTGLGLRTLRQLLPEESGKATGILTDISTQLSGAIWDLRHAITDLHHDQVSLRSLAAAAHDYAGQSARLTDQNVAFTAQGFEEPPGDAFVPTAFRQEVLSLLREGLSNAARHAAAGHVSIMLALQDDTLLLRIEDDGVGFDISQVASLTDGDGSHHGLRNMRHRTEELDGICRIESAPGMGTRLLFQIPLPPGRPVQQDSTGREPTHE